MTQRNGRGPDSSGHPCARTDSGWLILTPFTGRWHVWRQISVTSTLPETISEEVDRDERIPTSSFLLWYVTTPADRHVIDQPAGLRRPPSLSLPPLHLPFRFFRPQISSSCNPIQTTGTRPSSTCLVTSLHPKLSQQTRRNNRFPHPPYALVRSPDSPCHGANLTLVCFRSRPRISSRLIPGRARPSSRSRQPSFQGPS